MASTAETVRIHYRRPPDREEIFVQRLVYREPSCVVTLLERTSLARPVRAAGRIVLEDGAPVVWFTFPGLRHDIGRFHRGDGTFTGYYANVLTPVEGLETDEWHTTDLFLDVWRGEDGAVALLDEDELTAAVERGWLGDRDADVARAEADRILAAATEGSWPPPIARHWTIERARRALAPRTRP